MPAIRNEVAHRFTDYLPRLIHAKVVLRTLGHPCPVRAVTELTATVTLFHIRYTLRGTGTVTDLVVASYLAKYSTKGTEITGRASARITPDTVDLYADPGRQQRKRVLIYLQAAAGPKCSPFKEGYSKLWAAGP